MDRINMLYGIGLDMRLDEIQMGKMSEEQQLYLVMGDGRLIGKIIEAGIVPSEAVQIAAVKQNGFVIGAILGAGIVPSEAVQIAAVSGNPRLIRHIIAKGIVPSEDVIYRALSNAVYARKYVITYKELVRELYPNNELMQRKWFRFGDKARNQG